MMTRAMPILLTAALLATALPAAAQTRVKVTAVVAAPVRQALHLPGTLVSPRSSALSAQGEGRVDELLVEAGDRVEAGQPLLRLDDTVARLDLERLEHSLAEAEHLQRDAQRVPQRRHVAGDRTIAQGDKRFGALAHLADHVEILVVRHRAFNQPRRSRRCNEG